MATASTEPVHCEPPTVTVVICAYTERRWQLLIKALAAVQGQSQEPDELILVIDHNPVVESRLRALVVPEWKVISNKFERGLSGARNSGVAIATSDIVGRSTAHMVATHLQLGSRVLIHWTTQTTAHRSATRSAPRWQFVATSLSPVAPSLHSSAASGPCHWAARKPSWRSELRPGIRAGPSSTRHGRMSTMACRRSVARCCTSSIDARQKACPRHG